MKPFILGAIASLTLAGPTLAANPVVLELFTSQSCSSCPPADELLQTLATDSQLLALSFHVTYWDGADWRDPFSLAASTDRQRRYEGWLGQRNVYTPELVVDGAEGMVGSNQSEVTAAIERARNQAKPITVTLVRDADHQHLSISFTGTKPEAVKDAVIWLITFSPKAITAIHGGENRGIKLTSINNVSGIKQLAQATTASLPPLQVDLPDNSMDNYAVLVQSADTGAIIGAGSYLPVRS